MIFPISISIHSRTEISVGIIYFPNNFWSSSSLPVQMAAVSTQMASHNIFWDQRPLNFLQ